MARGESEIESVSVKWGPKEERYRERAAMVKSNCRASERAPLTSPGQVSTLTPSDSERQNTSWKFGVFGPFKFVEIRAGVALIPRNNF